MPANHSLTTVAGRLPFTLLQVFTREELQFIADLCTRHNTYALADEVYEHLVFEPHQHLSLRALPGMAERTIRLGSAGKTFSFTAWKVGLLLYL